MVLMSLFNIRSWNVHFEQFVSDFSLLIVGGFDLDQILPEHVAKVDPLIENFNLSQRSQYLWISNVST